MLDVHWLCCNNLQDYVRVHPFEVCKTLQIGNHPIFSHTGNYIILSINYLRGSMFHCGDIKWSLLYNRYHGSSLFFACTEYSYNVPGIHLIIPVLDSINQVSTLQAHNLDT